MRRRLLPTLLIPLLLVCPAASAQEPLRMTVDEAVATALTDHYDVRRSRENVTRLEGAIDEARSAVFPQLALEGGYGVGYDESAAGTLGGQVAADEEDFYYAKATARQILFSWGKLSGAIEAAQVETRRAELERAGVERTVKLEVHRAFNAILLSRRLVEVAEETLAQKEQHLDVANKRFEAGVVNKLEVLRSQSEVAGARVPLIEAKNRLVEASARMNHLLAKPQDVPFEADGTLNHVPCAALTYEEASDRALESRPETAALAEALRTARLVRDIRAAEDKPNVSAYGEYGYASEDMGHLGPDREVWSAGVVVTYPFFDGGRTRGLVAQAESDVRDLDLALAQARQAVRLEAKIAVNGLAEAEELLSASDAAVEQAQEALKLSETAFREGAATTLDVTDAALALTQARISQASALHDHMNARAVLAAVMNEL